MENDPILYLAHLDDVIANEYAVALKEEKNVQLIRNGLARYDGGLPKNVEHAVLVKSRVWRMSGVVDDVGYSNMIFQIFLKDRESGAKIGGLMIQNFSGHSRHLYSQMKACQRCQGIGCDRNSFSSEAPYSMQINPELQSKLIESLRAAFLGATLKKAIMRVHAESSPREAFDWNILFQSRYSLESNGADEFLQPVFRIGFPTSTPAPGGVSIKLGNEPELKFARSCLDCNGDGRVKK